MKIIEQKRDDLENQYWGGLRKVCENCHSVLELEKEDMPINAAFGSSGELLFECEVCALPSIIVRP